MINQNELFREFINEISRYDEADQLEEIRMTLGLTAEQSVDFNAVCETLDMEFTFTSIEDIQEWMDDNDIDY